MRLWRFGPTNFYNSIISRPIRRLDHTDRQVPTFSIVDHAPNRAADDFPLFLRRKLSVGADRMQNRSLRIVRGQHHAFAGLATSGG